MISYFVYSINRRSCASMRPRHPTDMVGGSVENAGAILDQYILQIVSSDSCPLETYGPSMDVASPAHPCARGIQYILYVKKPGHKPGWKHYERVNWGKEGKPVLKLLSTVFNSTLG